MGEKKNNWKQPTLASKIILHDGQLLFENIEESEAADAYVQNHLLSLYRLCPDISSINSSIDYSFLHS
jgi:hypothetical protein